MLMPVRTGPAVSADELRSRTQAIPPELVLLGLLTIVGAAIRFATLASQSYWVDESTTVHDISFGLGGLLHQIHVNETTPPLYFIVAWLWAKVFGTGEAGLRSLSALCGVITIPVAYLAARELVSRAAGLVAALLVAVSPFMVWYSQEARAYALFILLSGLSFLYWARAHRRRTTRDLVLWAVFSGLAVLTHFFAGFLIAPEAILLLYRLRNRATVLACTAVAVVQAAVLPMAISDTSHPLGWIQTFPLSVRIKQVPVDFALSSLYHSSIVTHGLLGAAIVAVVVVGLLAFASPSARVGAGLAAAIAGFVLLVPLVLAWAGRDYYVSRNLSPAWIPLAVVLGAACTAGRTRAARVVGGLLAAALVAGFLYAGIRIDRNPQYQRSNWRGVAEALGPRGIGPRAIVADDGLFAAQPLWVYLPGAPWLPNEQTRSAVAVREVDVVGGTWQTTPARLPAGVRLISRTPVDGLLVTRFALTPAWHLTPGEIAARAGGLLMPAAASPAVLIQSA
jgi:mannosyltransferase